MKLCDYEVKVLRACAGEKPEGLSWGAAMSVAIECLEGRGLIERGPAGYRATESGREYLMGAAPL